MKNLSQFPHSASRFTLHASRSSGIALILVLGILSIMLLMGVAFSISMRTERVAASNYSDIVRAREMLHVGLARAIDQIQQDLRGLDPADAELEINQIVDGLQDDLLVTNVYHTGDRVTLIGPYGLPNPLEEFVPYYVIFVSSTKIKLARSFRNAVTNHAIDLTDSGSWDHEIWRSGEVYPPWTVISSYSTQYDDPVSLLTGEATNYIPAALTAEVAQLDTALGSNYWYRIQAVIGTNGATKTQTVGRVAYLIINCSGLLDANFAGGLNVLRRKGTNVNEIAITNLDEIGGDGVFFSSRLTDVRYETVYELAELYTPPTNFFVYSYCPDGYWDNAASLVYTGLNLGTSSVSDLMANRNIIINGFTNSGFTTNQAGILFSNLIDYVDADSVPSNFTTCVESVPMINEITVSNVVDVTNIGGGTNRYTITCYVQFELWNPFVVDAGAFKLSYDVKFAPSGTPSTPIKLVPASRSGTDDLPNPFPNRSFFVTNAVFEIPSNPFVTNEWDPIAFTADVSACVKSGGTKVDDVETYPFPFSQSGANSSTNNLFLECLDPRFNWSPTNTAQWRYTSSHTLGTTNDWTASYLGPTNDGDTAMYVANTSLVSIAELGYLVYANTPWRTVKLYGTNQPVILDAFKVGTNTAYRGLVNPNSRVRDALATVFADMPVDSYPGGPAASYLNMTEARNIADQITNSCLYENVLEIGRGLTNFAGVTTELEKESFFRNAVGLFGIRQNVFMIIIEVNPASSGIIPRNPAKQRAVAIVWRDPFTGACFIRSIRWLED